MANQERRRALVYGLVFSFTLMATPVHAFGLKSLTDKLSGGGGGGSWSKIVTDWRDGLGGLAKQASIIGLAIADLAEALGHKEDAAVTRKMANSIADNGAVMTPAELGAYNDSTDKLTQKSAESLEKDAGSMDAATKAKVAEAMTKYVPGVIGAIPHTVKLIGASQEASKAPTPEVSDIKAVKVAAQIPEIMPKAFSFVQNAAEGANQLRELAKKAEISVPNDTIDMSSMKM
jgi:hypothetical protein